MSAEDTAGSSIFEDMRYARAKARVQPELGCGMGKGLVSVLIVGFAIVLACSPVHAREGARTIRQFQHTAWTAKEGAPPEIWALDQGPDGFLWLGTGSGLYRFDRIRFERFQPAPRRWNWRSGSDQWRSRDRSARSRAHQE